MTLLGWMHRKLMQNNAESTKNSMIGNPSSCFSLQTLEQNYYMEPTKTLSFSNMKTKKSPNFEADKIEGLFNDEAYEPFDFLAIGTFGLELLNTDPPTPTLPLPFENLTDEQADTTENDLKQLSYELEKFLEAEENENANDTSERSSQASAITLSIKPIDGADSEEQMYVVACPLQNYLFANSVEMSKEDKEVKKEKTSLGELFKRNNIASDDLITKNDGGVQEIKKRNLAHFMKKVVKKFHCSSSGCTTTSKTDTVASVSIKRKLSKALKMFQQKVHPEEKTEKYLRKLQKGKKENKASNACHMIGGENELGKFARGADEKNDEYNIKASPVGISRAASTVDEGHWIKTDSDYLVLEL